MQYPTCSVLCAALGLFIYVPHSQGALSVYEGFDYSDPAGTSLSGLNGGTGWDAAFPAPSGTANLQPGLSYPGLSTVGLATQWSPNVNFGAGRAWDTATAPPANGTYWFSALVQANGIAQGNFNWMYSTLSTNGQNGVGFRLSNVGGSANFRAISGNNDGTSNPQAGSTFAVGSTHLIVGRLVLDSSSGSVLRLWVNPDLASTPTELSPDTAELAISAADTATLRPSITGRAFGTGGADPAANNLRYDEIRIGTTFADVVPVPEPASGVFALVGMLGLVLRRRR